MQYSQLGKSGLRVSRLCLGAMTFGQGFHGIGVVAQESADEMVHVALEAGVNFFDTADVYSQGQSEEIVGRALKASGVRRESVVVATKVRGAMSTEAAEGRGDSDERRTLSQACHRGLSRQPAPAGSRLHRPLSNPWLRPRHALEETLEALNDLVRQGKVLYIGCSNLPARTLAKAMAICAARGWAAFSSLQAYYSLVGRDLEHELLPLCREEGLGVLPWSPLSGGYLSGKYRQGSPEVGRRNEFDFPPIAANAADALVPLEEVAHERSVSIACVALAWLRQQPGVTSVIIGARNLEQLHDNLGAADLDLTSEELQKLSAPTQPPKLYPQWMIEFQGAARRRSS